MQQTERFNTDEQAGSQLANAVSLLVRNAKDAAEAFVREATPVINEMVHLYREINFALTCTGKEYAYIHNSKKVRTRNKYRKRLWARLVAGAAEADHETNR